jgi:hypothetical protein
MAIYSFLNAAIFCHFYPALYHNNNPVGQTTTHDDSTGRTAGTCRPFCKKELRTAEKDR